MIRLYVTPAPMWTVPSSRCPLGELGDRGQVEQAPAAAAWPKLSPTIRSVPPAIGTASGVLGLGGERVGPGGGSDEVHGACQYDRARRRPANGDGVRTWRWPYPGSWRILQRKGTRVRLAALVERPKGPLGRWPAPMGGSDVEARRRHHRPARPAPLPDRWGTGADRAGLVAARAAGPLAAFVAALVAGGAGPSRPARPSSAGSRDDLVDACAEAGLPLLRVPVEHSFAAVTERATRQLAGREDLAAVLARHRALVTAPRPARAAGLARLSVLELVAADLGVRCWVLSPTGRLISGPALTPRRPGSWPASLRARACPTWCGA